MAAAVLASGQLEGDRRLAGGLGPATANRHAIHYASVVSAEPWPLAFLYDQSWKRWQTP